jgi:hypothetical protein
VSTTTIISSKRYSEYPSQLFMIPWTSFSWTSSVKVMISKQVLCVTYGSFELRTASKEDGHTGRQTGGKALFVNQHLL